MNRRRFYSVGILVLVAISFMALLGFERPQADISGLTKTSLREVGHHLLLANKDSTSLVLPVETVDETTFRVSFQNTLSILPDSLVTLVDRSLQKGNLPEDYLVEVLQCADEEVAYSYAIIDEAENNIVHCQQRTLPEDCYTLEVKFNPQEASIIHKQLAWLLLFITILALSIEHIWHRRKRLAPISGGDFAYTALGSLQFYPEQSKLVTATEEINLSIKECELLSILATHPNRVIKREELTKRVWEDHGVIVGRSLDTYISKLRKKLSSDDRLKITNVHGVGYKLEIRDT